MVTSTHLQWPWKKHLEFHGLAQVEQTQWNPLKIHSTSSWKTWRKLSIKWQELKTSQAPSGKSPEHCLGHLSSYTGSSMLPITYAFPPWFWETEAWILTLCLWEKGESCMRHRNFSSIQISIVSLYIFLLPAPSCCRTGALEGLSIRLHPSNASQSTPSTLGVVTSPHLQLGPWQSWSPYPAKPSFISASTHPSPSLE